MKTFLWSKESMDEVLHQPIYTLENIKRLTKGGERFNKTQIA